MAEMDIRTTRYLIIGNSAGGIGAVEAIRETDSKGTLTLISDEPYSTYSRPLISKYLSGERDFNGMLYRPLDFYEKNNVNVILGKRINIINYPTKSAVTADGEEIVWEKLLLATGGIPIVPKMEGTEKEGVFTFLTLNDARKLSEVIQDVQQAVVIGGGLIGISMTEALIKKNISVTIVEMKDRVLNTILDEGASAIMEEKLRDAGVAIITNNTVATITGDSKVEGVILGSGEKLFCDLVIIAIGVLPRTELVSNTDIKVNRGIIVDQYMMTSHGDVFSCGDAAEAPDFLLGSNRVIPIWPNAYIGGRTAGYNMAGEKYLYPGGTVMNSLNYFGLDIVSAGLLAAPQDSDSEILIFNKNGVYKKAIINDNKLIGMILIKEIENAGILFGIMRDKIDIHEFKEQLLTEKFGLAYLSKEKRLERMTKTLITTTTSG